MALSSVSAMAAAMPSTRVRASWDMNPSPKPLNFPKTLKKKTSSSSSSSSTTTTPQSLDSPAPSTAVIEKKPKEQHPAQFLAQTAHAMKELYARMHFLFPQSINEFNERVMKVVHCESQDLLLKKLLNEDYLTEEESITASINCGPGTYFVGVKILLQTKHGRTKRAGVAVYNRASSLETLIGYPYLTGLKRLEELMYQLGFSTGGSSEHIAKELRKNFCKQRHDTGDSEQALTGK